ncbi:MAG TPA: hypothetical protein PK417_08020 [Hyphomonas sp.]|nr:hypothetical protein [Hyphomonas sp.]
MPKKEKLELGSADALNVHPALRGFWTDHELMLALGLGSIDLAKDLQKRNMVEAGRYRTEAGKWARAWCARDVMRIAVVVELAQQAALSMKVSTAVASTIGASWLDLAISLDDLLHNLQVLQSEIEADMEESGGDVGKAWRNADCTVGRPNLVDLVIIDRRWVFIDYCVSGPGGSTSTQDEPVCELVEANTAAAKVMNIRQNHPKPAAKKSELRVELDGLAIDALRAVFGLRISVIRPAKRGVRS